MASALDELVERVRLEAQNADDTGRKEIYSTLERLSWSIESPYDKMQRIMYSQMQLPIIEVGLNLGLFKMLSESSGPLSSQQISDSTGAAPSLISRICRYLASVGVIDEHGENEWSANTTTSVLANPGWASGVRHQMMIERGYMQLPPYLEKRQYRAIETLTDTPLTESLDISGKNVFVHMSEQPAWMANFAAFMTQQRASQPACFDVYPLRQKTDQMTSDQVFFVDIGGSFGHQCAAVRQALPDLPNRVILQDLPPVLDLAPTQRGVEHIAQDFWHPQTVKGARIYYLRNILHDYSDELATQLLTHTREALSSDPEAVILIDEMVLPDTRAHRFQTQLDITMMMALAAKERTISQWRVLITGAGLSIKNIYRYTNSMGDSIIECVRA